MARSQDYLKFTEKVRQRLDQGIGPPSHGGIPGPSDTKNTREGSNEWLKLLYEQYTQRFINDNNKIWAVGTIFIPLCLAGLLSIKDLSPFNTALLGVGSIMLMWFWVIVAESHRAFQNRSQAVVEEIERHINFDIDWGPKLDPHKAILPPSRSVQRIRWNMLTAVIIIWVLATIGRIVDTYDIDITPPKFTPKQEVNRRIKVELVDSANAHSPR